MRCFTGQLLLEGVRGIRFLPKGASCPDSAPKGKRRANSGSKQPTQGQQPLTTVFSKMNTENEIDAAFAAAFGHAGIPCGKLGHPLIVGLIQKYIDVAGCARSPITLRKDPMQAQAHSQTYQRTSGIFRNKVRNIPE